MMIERRREGRLNGERDELTCYGGIAGLWKEERKHGGRVRRSVQLDKVM